MSAASATIFGVSGELVREENGHLVFSDAVARIAETLSPSGAAARIVAEVSATGASTMRVPVVRQSSHGGRWETIRYALDSNARTLRFCLIWVVVIVSPAVAAAIADLIRHTLLCR